MFDLLLDATPLTATVIMFSTMLFMMAIGAPMAWSLMISGMLSAYLMFGTGGLDLLLASAYSTMDNFILISLPLFLLMGLTLERSGEPTPFLTQPESRMCSQPVVNRT